MKTRDIPTTRYQIPPKVIALIGKHGSRDLFDLLATLARSLHQRGITVMIEAATASHFDSTGPSPYWQVHDFTQIGERADLAIALGGDGTLLNAARRLAPCHIPLVGINQGRLGFMTDIARNDMLSCMDALLNGAFVPEERMLLETEIIRNGKTLARNLALNEVVVDKSGISRLIEFGLLVDGVFVYTLRADGLIVSTPTGSTAYSLSANGPILHPLIAGIALVPLCPHSLTNRPILVSDQSEIEIRIVRATDARAHFDGQVRFDLLVQDRLKVRRAADSICFLHPPGYSYFAMLREKLHWNKESAPPCQENQPC